MWTEIELASRISEAPIIGITGSNGKTTTTTLLYHMLNIGGKHPLIAGNIGTVSCTVAEKATKDNIIVLEASSFQLMGTETFRPKIAIWTNLYDAHLDYHGTSEAYAEAKRQLRKIKQQKIILFTMMISRNFESMRLAHRAIKIPFSLMEERKRYIS